MVRFILGHSIKSLGGMVEHYTHEAIPYLSLLDDVCFTEICKKF